MYRATPGFVGFSLATGNTLRGSTSASVSRALTVASVGNSGRARQATSEVEWLVTRTNAELERIARSYVPLQPRRHSLRLQTPALVRGTFVERKFRLTNAPNAVLVQLPAGEYSVTEHDGQKAISLDPASPFDTKSRDEEASRLEVAQTLSLRKLLELYRSVSIACGARPIAALPGGETMTLYEDYERITLERLRGTQLALAVLDATEGIDEEIYFPKYTKRLLELYSGKSSPAGVDVLRVIDEMVHSVLSQKPPQREAMLAMGRLVANAALAAERHAPVFALPGIPRGGLKWDEAMRKLSLVKSSTDPAHKAAYVEWMKSNIFPYLNSELTYLNAMALTLAYMPLQTGTKIGRFLSVYEFSDADAFNADRGRVLELVGVYEETISEDLVHFYRSRGIDFRPSAKYQVWKTVGAGRPEFVVNVAGTTSKGPNFDALWEKRHITTGSYGNADPRGVARSAHDATMGILLDMLRAAGADKNSLITVTGHSQGGALAIRIHATLLWLKYANVYCCANSAPALDEVTVSLMQLAVFGDDGARRLIMTESFWDPVARGGQVTPHGIKFEHGFLTNPSGRSSVVKTDPIQHGVAHEAANQIIGLPSSAVVSFRRNKSSALLDWLAKTAITWVLPPTQFEASYRKWAVRLKESAGDIFPPTDKT